jgi:hypothetical protein
MRYVDWFRKIIIHGMSELIENLDEATYSQSAFHCGFAFSSKK